MITLEQAKNLKWRQEIYHNHYRQNGGKTPETWRVNGQVKTWKTRPNEVKVPIKHSLYSFSYLTHNDLNEFSLTKEEAMGENNGNSNSKM